LFSAGSNRGREPTIEHIPDPACPSPGPTGRVQPHVGDLGVGELVRYVRLLSIEHYYIFQFATIRETNVYSLVTHAGLGLSGKTLDESSVECDSHDLLVRNLDWTGDGLRLRPIFEEDFDSAAGLAEIRRNGAVLDHRILVRLPSKDIRGGLGAITRTVEVPS
jgi:hypothetical protein